MLRGGTLHSNKGVNLKHRLLSLPSLTTKGRRKDLFVNEQQDCRLHNCRTITLALKDLETEGMRLAPELESGSFRGVCRLRRI